MENLIKNLKINVIDYNELTKDFYLVYSFNLGDSDSKENVCILPYYKKNTPVGELLEEFKTHAYNNLTLEEIAPYYEVVDILKEKNRR